MLGAVRSYHALLACRFFLGLFEGNTSLLGRLFEAYSSIGGVFPGLVLYLSFFYPRQRLQWRYVNNHSCFQSILKIVPRISAFFSAASISGAFSGLLAFGIINMNGIGNRPGWAWIFILEGLFTVIFGLFSYILLPSSPAHARFLTEDEKRYVISELKEDGATGRDESIDGFSWEEVGMAFKLPQVWMLAVLFFFAGSHFVLCFEIRKLTHISRDYSLRDGIVRHLPLDGQRLLIVCE